jgi:SAM-dependent methyltransferase
MSATTATLPDNPLLRSWHDLVGGDWRTSKYWGRRKARGCAENETALNWWNLRTQYSYAVPNEAALRVLVKHSPIVELGAGTGYWAALATQVGADVIAFDIAPPVLGDERNHYHKNRQLFFHVQEGDVAKAAECPNRTLFLCWPPYSEDMAHRALLAHAGQTVIYVGEGQGGCTGDDAFHELLESSFECIETVHIPQWYGLHDWMSVWRRK